MIVSYQLWCCCIAAQVTDWMLQYDWGKNYVFNKNAKATVMKQTKGKYPAPLRIIDVSHY